MKRRGEEFVKHRQQLPHGFKQAAVTACTLKAGRVLRLYEPHCGFLAGKGRQIRRPMGSCEYNLEHKHIL